MWQWYHHRSVIYNGQNHFNISYKRDQTANLAEMHQDQHIESLDRRVNISTDHREAEGDEERPHKCTVCNTATTQSKYLYENRNLYLRNHKD